MKLLRTKSTMRYFPPKGTAGLARSFVSGYSRVPLPPARTIPSTRNRISACIVHERSPLACVIVRPMPVSSREAVKADSERVAPESDARRWTVVGLLCLGIIIAYVDRTNFSVALAAEDLKNVFRFTNADRGNLNAAF